MKALLSVFFVFGLFFSVSLAQTGQGDGRLLIVDVDNSNESENNEIIDYTNITTEQALEIAIENSSSTINNPSSGGANPDQEVNQSNIITCTGVDCTTCDVIATANNIINWLIGILTVVFAVLIVMAGFKLVVSGGNPEAKTKAKGYMTNAVIGFVLVLSAWLIIDTFLRVLLPSGDGTFDNGALWSEITCYGGSE